MLQANARTTIAPPTPWEWALFLLNLQPCMAGRNASGATGANCTRGSALKAVTPHRGLFSDKKELALERGS